MQHNEAAAQNLPRSAQANRLPDLTLAAAVGRPNPCDAANRLIDAGDVVYPWDAHGNLVYDGVYCYTHNAAGRMVGAENVTTPLRYTYTGDGLRMQQGVPGAVTAFAWDWATGVPQLLTDGDKRYLVGHDTLGWEDAGGWTYAVPAAVRFAVKEAELGTC